MKVALCFWLLYCWRTAVLALRPPTGFPASKAKAALLDTRTMPQNSAFKPLSVSAVEKAMDDATRKENELPRLLLESKKLRLQRVEDWTTTLSALDEDATYFKNTKTPWYFGLSIIDTETEEVVGLFSFYVAYSSWNGRILYVDRMDVKEDTEELLLRMLARIAVDLDCARITWRHTTTPAWHTAGKNKPEMHGEVLTLSMDEKAMSAFISDSSLTSLEPLQGSFEENLVESAFRKCLDNINQNSSFRLRLAKHDDLSTMTGLIQGLADYVNESDAVHMKANDFVQDGFDLEDPLWYCLLVDKLDEDGICHTCGYAFVFVGYILGQGRFLYLEDLYLEVEHRGDGGGTTVMRALAGLCRAMQCTRLYWQALDWNETGLNFYKKIGATIHSNELTSRYVTDALKQFAARGTDGSVNN